MFTDNKETNGFLLFVAIFIIAKVFIGLSILHSFIAIVAVSLILTPVTLRLSRIIWINLFVSYKKEAKELQSEK